MLFRSWLARSRNSSPARRSPLRVESLEGRDLMAATLAISDVSLSELNGGGGNRAYFSVTLSEPATETVTVNYQTANGSAMAGNDYVAAAGTLTFVPGETSKTFYIQFIGDNKNEPDETFFVNLSGAINADIVDGQGVGTIINDDGGMGGGGGRGGGCKGHQ